MPAKIRTREFTGVRVQVDTPLPFDEVIARLRRWTGHAPMSEIVAVSNRTPDAREFARQIETRLIGESGFMVFAEIDHGRWISKFGIRRRTVRWLVGNPLIAITMIRRDIAAGLFAPVELLITEGAEGSGAVVYYVRPSSLIAIGQDDELRDAALALDRKFEALVARATGD